MKKIQIGDFGEETRYVWECPSCQEMSESYEDPNYETTVCCDHCLENFEIEHD